jgi:hypothetical protein
MYRFTALCSLGLFASLVVAAPGLKKDSDPFIDLKEYANGKLKENLHSNRYEGNDLSSLPTGKQKLGDHTFFIGEKLLQLKSAQVAERPEKIEGIKVNRTMKKLHFLNACGYSAEPDTVIGKYIVRYDDESTAEIEIVYGRDVVDWWAYPDQAAPTKGKVAWEGENAASKGFEAKIKLYVLTWENPKPDKKVATIDFVATKPDQSAAPFCVAITAEE